MDRVIKISMDYYNPVSGCFDWSVMFRFRLSSEGKAQPVTLAVYGGAGILKMPASHPATAC